MVFSFFLATRHSCRKPRGPLSATQLEVPLSLLLHRPVDGVFESLALFAVLVAGLLVVGLSFGRIDVVWALVALLSHGLSLGASDLLGLLLLAVVHFLSLAFQLLFNFHALLGHLEVVAAGLCALVIAASVRLDFVENARRFRLWLHEARTKFGSQSFLLFGGNVRHEERATAVVLRLFVATTIFATRLLLFIRLVTWVFVFADATGAGGALAGSARSKTFSAVVAGGGALET